MRKRDPVCVLYRKRVGRGAAGPGGGRGERGGGDIHHAASRSAEGKPQRGGGVLRSTARWLCLSRVVERTQLCEAIAA